MHSTYLPAATTQRYYKCQISELKYTSILLFQEKKNISKQNNTR